MTKKPVITFDEAIHPSERLDVQYAQYKKRKEKEFAELRLSSQRKLEEARAMLKSIDKEYFIAKTTIIALKQENEELRLDRDRADGEAKAIRAKAVKLVVENEELRAEIRELGK